MENPIDTLARALERNPALVSLLQVAGVLAALYVLAQLFRLAH